MGILPASKENIDKAAEALRAGRLVAFPTETVYGLAADATNGEAVAAIFEAKGRPRFNPLIVHLLDLKAVEKHVHIEGQALQLAEKFWPGPLTLILPRRKECDFSELVSAGGAYVGVRIPSHPVARTLMESAERPLAAPSANRSGAVSPTMASHVWADLGDRPAYILDGGVSVLGLESTIIGWPEEGSPKGTTVLRPGAISTSEIEAFLGEALLKGGKPSSSPSSPGQLESHYAPQAKLRLEAQNVRPGEALLAFGADIPKTDQPMINLSNRGDLCQAAAHLFAALRALDDIKVKTIAVMTIPAHGLGEAINDRLRRAAAPREKLEAFK